MPRFGRYETIEALGRGGTSVVYRARDTATEREVAVKVLSSHLLQDAGLMARFEREIKLAVRLEHPHIASILDVGREGEHPYIVMRLLAGGSLSDLIRRGPLSTAETVRILQEVASALDEAHRQNIVHRDLKPSNILFDQRGTAYLADFGVARLMDSAESLTASAGVVGTPAYMSPEQLKGQPVTGLADQYALGLVAFQALTARLPYEGTTAQMILQQLQEPLPSVRRYNAGLSPTFERVLARATAKDPGARYASASEFAAALATAAAEAAPVAPASASRDLNTEPDLALMTPSPPTRLSVPASSASPAAVVSEPGAVLPPSPQLMAAGAAEAVPQPLRRRDWRVYALLVLALVVVIGLGWQWLNAATPGVPAATHTATATGTEPAATASLPPPSDTADATVAASGFVTLDPDAIGLAVVSLPPGLAAAAVYNVPQGVVIATVPDRSIVQVLRGREVTPDSTLWVQVKLLTGEVGWMVEGLLTYIRATETDAVTETAAATGDVTRPVQPGATATATRPAPTGTPRPTNTAGDGSLGPATPAPDTPQPASPAAPAATAGPPASNTAPPPSATSAPPTNTVAPPTPVPATNTPVPPTSAPPPTATDAGLVCNLLPILCP